MSFVARKASCPRYAHKLPPGAQAAKFVARLASVCASNAPDYPYTLSGMDTLGSMAFKTLCELKMSS